MLIRLMNSSVLTKASHSKRPHTSWIEDELRDAGDDDSRQELTTAVQLTKKAKVETQTAAKPEPPAPTGYDLIQQFLHLYGLNICL